MTLAPTHDYRRTAHRVPPPPLTGLDAAVNSLIGRRRRAPATLRALEEQAALVTRHERAFVELSDHDLQLRLLEFRSLFRRGGRLPSSVLAEALAAIREAADRQLGLRPFPVQITGALALHRGYLA